MLREEAINLAKEEADRRAKEELNSKKTPPSSPPHSDKWESAKPNENNKQTKRLSGKVTLISCMFFSLKNLKLIYIYSWKPIT